MVMTKEWLAPQKATLVRMYETGAPISEIAETVGRSEGSVRRAVGRWKLHRPAEHRSVDMRANLAWPRIRAVLADSHGLTIAEICAALGMFKSVVIRTIGDHRAELDVVSWIPGTRKPTAVWAIGTGRVAVKPIKAKRVMRAQANHFSVAAGLISAPKGEAGRVYCQSMDVKDEELEAA
jgi:hypothetical protein